MIKIETKKVLTSMGEEGYEVVGISALGRNSLPKEYTKGYPWCYSNMAGTELVYSGDNGYCQFFKVGKVFTKQEWEEIISFLHKCGERLHEINQERKRKAASWCGNETFVI